MIILSAPKWLSWTGAALFWIFVIAALSGHEVLSALAYMGFWLLGAGLFFVFLAALLWRLARRFVPPGQGLVRRRALNAAYAPDTARDERPEDTREPD